MGLEYNFIFVSQTDAANLVGDIVEKVPGAKRVREDRFALPGLSVMVFESDPSEMEAHAEGHSKIPATRLLMFRLTDYSVPDLEAGIVRVIDYLLAREKGDAALMSLGDGPPDLIRRGGDLVLYDNIGSEQGLIEDPKMRALLTHPYRVIKRSGRFAK